MRDWAKYRRDTLRKHPIEHRLSIIFGWMKDQKPTVPTIRYKQFKRLVDMAYGIGEEEIITGKGEEKCEI